MLVYDVVIIGGGITGLAIARNLSQYQLRVAILEKEPDIAMGATKANSAIVHGGYAEHHSTLKGQLCYQGRRQFEKLNKDLHFGFKPIGSLVMTTNDQDLPKLEAMLDNGIKNGLTDLSIISRDEIISLEPNINFQVKYALYCKGAGICSPYGMAIALAENAVENGVALHLNQAVVNIEDISDTQAAFESVTENHNHTESCQFDQYKTHHTTSTTSSKKSASTRFIITTHNIIYQADFVINCAGFQADDISALLYKPDYKIQARTGEYLVFQRGSGQLIKQVVFQMPSQMGKGILVTPTVHDNLIIGPDAINEAGHPDRSTHAPRLASIFYESLHTCSKLDPTKMIRSFTGVRSVASTDDFIIRMSPVFGFIEAAGIQSPGLTSSPAIADKVILILKNNGLKLIKKENFIAKRKPPMEITDFKPMTEVIKLTEISSGPDKIICRCEQVNQAIITDAINRGLPVHTIDAVKRRTRAGMGICQGTFCRPRVIKQLEKMGFDLVDALTDAQRLKLDRVTRKEFIDYLKNADIADNNDVNLIT